MHGQADHGGFGAFSDMQPVESVLVAEGARLASPLSGVQIFFDLLLGDGIHEQSRRIDQQFHDMTLVVHQAQAAMHQVFLISQQREHAFGVLTVSWFAEDLTAAFGDGIAAKDIGVAMLAADVGRLGQRQAARPAPTQARRSRVEFPPRGPRRGPQTGIPPAA